MMENSDRYIPTETIQLTIVDQLRSLIDRGAPGSSIYLRALGAIETLRRERDEARDVLSGLAFYLGVNSGDETTTAAQFSKRIYFGIDRLTRPMGELRDAANRERDAAIARAEKAERELDEARATAKIVCDSYAEENQQLFDQRDAAVARAERAESAYEFVCHAYEFVCHQTAALLAERDALRALLREAGEVLEETLAVATRNEEGDFAERARAVLEKIKIEIDNVDGQKKD